MSVACLNNAQANAVVSAHDEYMVQLHLNPLPDNCDPILFERRVNEALHQHVPFLSRRFATLEDVSRWVISQLPSDLS